MPLPILLLAAVVASVPFLPPAPALAPTWVAPLDGPIVVARAFAPPATRWGAGHRGVDLSAPVGAVVRAAGAGTVSFASDLAGRGVLVVTHGALRTTYEPVTPIAAVDEYVLAGEAVAYLDPGHGSVAPPSALLHWGLLQGDEYLDPLSLLRRGPSRLVPVAPAQAADAPDAGSVTAGRGASAAAAVPRGAVPAPPGGPAPGAPASRRSRAAAALPAVATAAPFAVAAAAVVTWRRVRAGLGTPARTHARARASP